MATKKNNNDAVILQLRKQIEEKKKALKGIERFVPITNCSLEIDGLRTNFHVLDALQLTLVLLKLNSYRMSAVDLEISDPQIGGYKLSEWISDVQSKLLITNKAKEEARLKILEAKVTELLSLDKKTELLLDDLAAQI